MINLEKLKSMIKKESKKDKIKVFFKKILKTLSNSIVSFNLHYGTSEAGYLAYSVLFSIFPFIIFFTLLMGYFGQTEIGIKLLQAMEDVLPEYIVKTIIPVIDSVINAPKKSILSIATLTLIWSSSSIVQSLKNVLDKTSGHRVRRSYFFRRFLSILKFLLLVLLLIVLITTTIVLPKVADILETYISTSSSFLNSLTALNIEYDPNKHFSLKEIFLHIKPFLIISFLLIFISSIYYIIPTKRQKFKEVLWGALLTLCGWMISIKILAFYLEKTTKFQLVYGSLAGIIITLFFFYIMAIILIFGAEFNYNLKKVFKEE